MNNMDPLHKLILKKFPNLYTFASDHYFHYYENDPFKYGPRIFILYDFESQRYVMKDYSPNSSSVEEMKRILNCWIFK